MANLFREDRRKLLNADFTILRISEPEKTIKQLVNDSYCGIWKIHSRYKTKAEMNEYVHFVRHNQPYIIFET
jgi:hypothetical protein